MILAAVRCPRCDKELEGLAIYCHDCEEYVDSMGSTPTLRTPAAAIPDDRLEDDIQLAIKKALELLGFHVYDLSQGRKTRQTPGLADLYIVGLGRCVWAEIKTAKGRHRDDQKTFGERVVSNGGEYHLWRHENEAIEWATAVLGVLEAGAE